MEFKSKKILVKWSETVKWTFEVNIFLFPNINLKNLFIKKLIIKLIIKYLACSSFIYIKFLNGISYLKTSEDIYFFFYFSEPRGSCPSLPPLCSATASSHPPPP